MAAYHHKTSLRLLAVVAVMALASGCSTYQQTVPGYCVGKGFEDSRSDKEPINFLKLRRTPPDTYRLDERDVLGIYIEGVLGSKEEAPPVHFPEDADIPPAIGYPVPIRENGTVSLPLVDPIDVRGMSLQQAEQAIREAYIDAKILKPDRERIIVTLMRPRTYHVLVVREDETTDTNLNGSNNADQLALMMQFGQTRRGMTHAVELKAYENDVLHALSETGGLPGTDAQNEIVILRGGFESPEQRDFYMQSMNDPTARQELANRKKVVRIPLRIGPNDEVPNLVESDIILNAGDVIFVQSRETEVFYTGGLLDGGQYPLPRDYDIDVLQAMALAGGNFGASAGSGGGLLGGGTSNFFPPSRVIVLRELCGEQVPIEINLRRAVLDKNERVIIQPGDFILLEYTPLELVGNTVLGNIGALSVSLINRR